LAARAPRRSSTIWKNSRKSPDGKSLPFPFQ
jgi:hypothetical protein